MIYWKMSTTKKEKTIQGKRTKENQDKQRRAGALRKRKTGRTKGTGTSSEENYGR